MLEIVGLDNSAQTVYELLIDNPPATFDDICQRVDIDDACLRKVLEKLLSLGLVKSTACVPPKFTATAPDVALEVLLLEQQEQIKRARLYVEQLAGRYVRTAAGWEPTELVEVVSGQQAVAQLVEQIVRSTSHEIRFIDKHPYVVAPTVLAPVEAEMLRRGIAYRALYDTAGLATRSIQAEIEPAIAMGEQARVLPEAPVKLILSDRRLALLPLQSNPTMVDSVVAVHPSAILDALSALFEALWRTALPIPADSTRPVGASSLTPEDARLITLLTAGLPDQAVARQLGLSYRTFQRRLGALIEFLGVRTRFQAGLQAAFHGLVPPPSSPADQPGAQAPRESGPAGGDQDRSGQGAS
ncbi:DNA-binding NarL/FixJ family response regulator/predicted DNA-binding transcriptional regulator [Kibdelosporangium banguiense]|uniref:DNA-binding NarL/FixJ family response regulator/predicted DNA-binding transcriptional regulator n=1 Tax=Kibdelosporangium banguiense TaxID=1365924 RepID=A0ABS4TG69_9PSEU|nr:helix-turn-helix domain-containing protein [Kibdelosporangium banguiense]MBP2323417.1 DNA-binding NarL/FixJ family response regulator/predicted DNA-binding transcriptional regulator [Kibdelosporangium banguiense]